MFDAEAVANNILNDAIAQDAKHVWVEPKRDHLRVGESRESENAIIETMDLPKDHALPLVSQFIETGRLE